MPPSSVSPFLYPLLVLLLLLLAHLDTRVDGDKKVAEEYTAFNFDRYSSHYGHFPESLRLEMLSEARKMFDFGYSCYMKCAFPQDELDPINCKGRGPDVANPSNININDVLGDYSLTLVDTLDTLAIMGNASEFRRAVQLVVDNVNFDKPNTVQVFEANIRVLGGLLSAHLMMEDPDQPFGDLSPDWYMGDLLTLAHDLADRLLVAFTTEHGIPHPRVNLLHGVPENGFKESCTAGIGSLILELGMLSRLLGDPIYESYARQAIDSLWQSRHNKTGLFGNVLNIYSKQWTSTFSGIGAGFDSFFEYLLKSHILFQEESDRVMFEDAYATIKQYLRRGRERCNEGIGTHPLYVNVDMTNGNTANHWIDSLQAAFPGLQVLHGDLEEAICHHAVFYAIWKKFGCLPERYNWALGSAAVNFYPLRPELAESTYLLYQATKSPFYLHVGRDILESLNTHTRTHCGYATVHDVIDKSLEDRQESFFLSETCKYLFLLFDVDNPINSNAEKYLFTTEGHVFPISNRYRRKVWEEEDVIFNRRNRLSPASSTLTSYNTSLASSCENSRGVNAPHILPLKSTYLDQIFSQFGIDV